MSGLVDFDTESAVPDWPLASDTGVGGMEDGFCQDEELVLGIADRPIFRDS